MGKNIGVIRMSYRGVSYIMSAKYFFPIRKEEAKDRRMSIWSAPSVKNKEIVKPKSRDIKSQDVWTHGV